MSEWISVKDRLPPINVPVLAIYVYFDKKIIQTRFLERWRIHWEFNGKRQKWTHWMPLPELPNQEIENHGKN